MSRWIKKYDLSIILHGLILMLLLLFLGAATAKADKSLIMVSILPQKYFVEKIAGDILDSFDVKVMVLPGASPATYEPTPSQMLQLSRARVYFSIGVPFERSWLPRFASTYPDLTIVATDAGFAKRTIRGHRHHDDGHGHSHSHGEDFPDPHIWLSPELVKYQAITILDALQAHFPDKAAAFTAGYESFIDEIEGIDREIRKILESQKGRSFFVFHPSWGYFADAYELEQIPVEVGGREPTPGELAVMIRQAREKDAVAVFVQPQFSQRSATIIANAINADLVVLDPLAENWGENLIKAARALRDHAR
ncbi:zinc ABC transporter substrate-binding protein [Desulfobotulus sp. H1]|uniref:Zinc ABC transporter substrate-binding protein n=1 Tax=Desulfobotulus pelophilus TaxID=2823377 RepID=A0ABT3NCN5_9BACT|nr:zinc ABC transporter substrate-binding protein [Desulfobotulus pelophilus]MCW7755216.1 zinc ABC transporter substrate-binding protein [Desulfobotulus pelophilus]